MGNKNCSEIPCFREGFLLLKVDQLQRMEGFGRHFKAQMWTFLSFVWFASCLLKREHLFKNWRFPDKTNNNLPGISCWYECWTSCQSPKDLVLCSCNDKAKLFLIRLVCCASRRSHCTSSCWKKNSKPSFTGITGADSYLWINCQGSIPSWELAFVDAIPENNCRQSWKFGSGPRKYHGFVSVCVCARSLLSLELFATNGKPWSQFAKEKSEFRSRTIIPLAESFRQWCLSSFCHPEREDAWISWSSWLIGGEICARSTDPQHLKEVHLHPRLGDVLSDLNPELMGIFPQAETRIQLPTNIMTPSLVEPV